MKYRRLYYLIDTLDNTVAIARDLEKKGIGYNQMHVLGKNEEGFVRHHLHSATPFQEYDIIKMGERGVILGTLVGLIFIIALDLIEPFGVELSFWILLAIWGLFILHGAWAGGLVGTHVHNYRITQFKDDIEQGKYLLLIDVDEPQEGKVQDFMKGQHQGARYEGESSKWGSPLEGWPFARH